jgi:hypothetical protein
MLYRTNIMKHPYLMSSISIFSRDKSIPGIMFSEAVRETLGDAYWQRVHASWYQSGLTVSCHVFIKTGF